jgi:hypothetical protein
MLLVAAIVQSLGHAVVATSTDVAKVGALTSREHRTWHWSGSARVLGTRST